MELTPTTARAILAAIGIKADGLEPIPSRGVAHDHFRLLGAGLVLRVPVWKRLVCNAEESLRHQAAAFTRAEPSGHTPRLIKIIPPGVRLPMGALVVAEARGRPPRLPDDLPAIAKALAALHRSPVPEPRDMAPLEGDTDPLAALLALVAVRASVFSEAGMPAESIRLLTHEVDAARIELEVLRATFGPGPQRLIGTDVHPGNFIITDEGCAVFVDLERAQYGHPAMDLAHATLPTSTRWDPAVATTLTKPDLATFLTAWRDAVGDKMAAAVAPAEQVARRLVWLRTLTWMARWRLDGGRLASPIPESLIRHLRRHADEVLSPPSLRAMAQEWR